MVSPVVFILPYVAPWPVYLCAGWTLPMQVYPDNCRHLHTLLGTQNEKESVCLRLEVQPPCFLSLFPLLCCPCSLYLFLLFFFILWRFYSLFLALPYFQFPVFSFPLLVACSPSCSCSLACWLACFWQTCLRSCGVRPGGVRSPPPDSEAAPG